LGGEYAHCLALKYSTLNPFQSFNQNGEFMSKDKFRNLGYLDKAAKQNIPY